jgi:hypothetical protein
MPTIDKVSSLKDLIAALPAKGEKRISAISELGRSEAQVEALMELAETEKGKSRTAATAGWAA